MTEEASSGGADPSAEPLRLWQEKGDLEALNELLRIEVTILKQMIRSRKSGVAGGSVATSDIAQEAVLRLLKVQSDPSFDNPRALRGYLWKSAWHLLVQRFEKKRTVPLDLESGDLPGLERLVSSNEGLGGLDRSERSAALGLAMNLLALEDRELIRLVYFSQKDIEAAGEELGITRGAANSRLVRARRELAKALASWSDLIG
jgi:RNA polymerase sigma factor (sigma-70 family)